MVPRDTAVYSYKNYSWCITEIIHFKAMEVKTLSCNYCFYNNGLF